MEETGTTLALAFISILANIGEMMGVLSINQLFTITLSVLSIIYLVFGIFIRYIEIRKKLKNEKREET